MVSQLKPGMSKEQVRLVLGTPLLTDIFHADRWDYVYWRETPGGKREQRKLAVFFEDGKLARLDGDVVLRPTSDRRPMKIAIAGAGGRMGRALIEAVLRRRRARAWPSRSTWRAARRSAPRPVGQIKVTSDLAGDRRRPTC